MCCPLGLGLSIGGETDGIHSYTPDFRTVVEDVTTFDSGIAGDFIACRILGTIQVNTYKKLNGISLGDTGIPWSFVACDGNTISGEATCSAMSFPTDAKAIPSYPYEFNVTGTVTGL